MHELRGRERVTCRYCGTKLFVGPDGRAAEAPRAFPVVWLSVVSLFVAVFVASIVTFVRRGPPSTPAVSPPPAAEVRDKTPHREAPSTSATTGVTLVPLAMPLFFDANGDGVQDLVGRFRHTEGDPRPWLGAVDGRRGEVLWSNTDDHGAFEGPTALIGDTLVYVDRRGELVANDPRRGTTLWSRALEATSAPGARVLCAGDHYVGVRSGSLTAYSVSTGSKVTPAPSSRCRPAYGPEADGPNFDTIPNPPLRSVVGLELPGLKPLSALVPTVGIARIVLALDQGAGPPGSAMPTVVAVAEGKELWRTMVPTSSTAPAQLTTPPRAAVRHGFVVVPYLAGASAEHHLACFDLATGRRSWDRTLPNQRGSSLRIAIAQDPQLLVWNDEGHTESADDASPRRGGALHMVDLRAGTVHWSTSSP